MLEKICSDYLIHSIACAQQSLEHIADVSDALPIDENRTRCEKFIE